MKNIITLAFAFVIGTTAFAQSISNDEVAIAKARAEVQATCLAGTGEIQASAWQDLDGNFNVYFYQSFKCPPNQICLLYFRYAPLARVTVSSSYEVLSSTCGFTLFELK